jgi:molybdenum cofactor biosynthesis enzyme
MRDHSDALTRRSNASSTLWTMVTAYQGDTKDTEAARRTVWIAWQVSVNSTPTQGFSESLRALFPCLRGEAFAEGRGGDDSDALTRRSNASSTLWTMVTAYQGDTKDTEAARTTVWIAWQVSVNSTPMQGFSESLRARFFRVSVVKLLRKEEARRSPTLLPASLTDHGPLGHANSYHGDTKSTQGGLTSRLQLAPLRTRAHPHLENGLET